MWIFRLALTAIVLVLVLLIGIIEHVITWVVAKFDPKAALQMRSAYVRAGFTAVRFVAVGKTQIIGLENIPTDRAVLFIGNHRSMLDVVICGSVIPVPVGFISKIELEKIPLLHMQMKDINCLFLDRSDDRKALKTILKAIELVKGGQSMFIFPEGTRSKDHFPRIKAAPVVVEFGKPIETAEMGRDEQKELPDRVRNLIIETYERNRKLL